MFMRNLSVFSSLGNFVDVLSLNNKGEVDKNNYYITHRSAEMLYEGCRDTPFAGKNTISLLLLVIYVYYYCGGLSIPIRSTLQSCPCLLVDGYFVSPLCIFMRCFCVGIVVWSSFFKKKKIER